MLAYRSRLFSSRSRLSLFAGQHELREQADAYAGGTFHSPRLVAVGIRGSRDIKVSPGEAVHELAEKPSGGDTAGRPASAVLDVGDIRLHQITVILPEGERPHPLAG